MNIPKVDKPIPKVSVLIRTMGRRSLLAAVESVRNQTFKEWELLVVNASGQFLQPLAHECWSAIDRVIDPGHPLDRSSAANMLLDASRGQFAIFLDDDDWFLEDHLITLVKALEDDATLVAAYSDVECLEGAGTASQVSTHRFERDFDFAALQLENYLPIHAVMFRRESALTGGVCRFDPSLMLFVDWDFWLQLAAKGPFKRVPGISAIYALSVTAGSGHTEANNLERSAMLTRLAERQLKRWTPADVVALTLHEANRTNQLNQEKQSADLARLQLQQTEQMRQLFAERETQLAATQQTLKDLQVHLRLQQLEIDKLGRIRVDLLDQLNALIQSTSWRITRPLRMARRVPAKTKNASAVRFVTNVMRAVGSQIARHGFWGLFKRIPYFVSHRRVYWARMGSQKPAERVGAFAHAPPRLRDIRLHPDLTGAGATMDAKVSVVIPTFNAGPEFVWMLRKLRAQLAVREIEIVVVDSGSSDATVTLAREAGAKVIEILPSEFSHSYARNLGADHASGDYLLFMVQDAYPIGDHWLYGILRFLVDHADQGLAAASCAEYSRVDSDMMYDSMIHTHYRFLGCLEVDRIGEYKGDDHMALRSQGQLSDVSCLISRACFQEFRYRGNYAEDLDLGIRLIKSGRRVAMLASVKVIHSHNRPAYYYLKRSFVDVIFLVGLFDDFTYPRCESLPGLIAGIEATARHISKWLAQLEVDRPVTLLGQQLEDWIAQSRRTFSVAVTDTPISLGEESLDTYVATMSMKYLGDTTLALDAVARDEARRFNDVFLARLEHFHGFANDVYGAQDALLRSELSAVVSKTFAAAAGSALAFFCLDPARSGDVAADAAKTIRNELTAGV